MILSKYAINQPTLWPESLTLQLIELQAAGKSFGEIGAVMGLSRNAVAEKCTRLGLVAVARVDPVPRRIAIASRPAAVLDTVVPLNIAFTDRSRFECSYLVGPQTVCGNPIARGSCCAGHALIVYQASKKAA